MSDVDSAADDLVALITGIVERIVAEVQPYRATVISTSQGKVRVQAADEDASEPQFYAREAGFKVNPGDEVIVQRVSGEPVIRGILQADTPGVRAIEGGIDASDVVAGELPGARIAPLAASQIQSGTFSTSRMPFMAAGIINEGTFDDARIPTLSATKIDRGTFAEARIPTLTAGKIPLLDADKIATGLIDSARIPNITVKEAESIVVSDLAALRFNGVQFNVADNGGGEAEITQPVLTVKEGTSIRATNWNILRFNSVQFIIEVNASGEVEIGIAP
jgi:hypothetical protein